ncbi:contactin [Elysia marginata]|uniref:Contactin n=1 Tax=Elysia marginata TaxID=1093978 RepID=A0AAV4HXW8_9GAST|nr:contactin [Elysia marginata]
MYLSRRCPQIWLWPANESPMSAELIEIAGTVFRYTLRDLERNTLYALRLAAVGQGGYGKKTPTIYFTVGELSVIICWVVDWLFGKSIV